MCLVSVYQIHDTEYSEKIKNQRIEVSSAGIVNILRILVLLVVRSVYGK